MKILSILLLTSSLFATTHYETRSSQQNSSAMQNKKLKCRTICDKQIYKEQKIEEAVSFYKNNKNYKFNRNGFSSFE
jgi:hypothetical protein